MKELVNFFLFESGHAEGQPVKLFTVFCVKVSLFVERQLLKIFLFSGSLCSIVMVVEKLAIHPVTFQSDVQSLRRHRSPAVRKRTEMAYGNFCRGDHEGWIWTRRE